MLTTDSVPLPSRLVKDWSDVQVTLSI